MPDGYDMFVGLCLLIGGFLLGAGLMDSANNIRTRKGIVCVAPAECFTTKRLEISEP